MWTKVISLYYQEISFFRIFKKFGLVFKVWCLAVKSLLSPYAVNELAFEVSRVRAERSRRKKQLFRLKGADQSRVMKESSAGVCPYACRVLEVMITHHMLHWLHLSVLTVRVQMINGKSSLVKAEQKKYYMCLFSALYLFS